MKARGRQHDEAAASATLGPIQAFATARPTIYLPAVCRRTIRTPRDGR
jgi:hypothetical protein